MENHGIDLGLESANMKVDMAFAMARKAHEGQSRKYTGEPYIVHPVSVARRIAKVFPDVSSVCAALLHDVIEDCAVTREQIAATALGFDIAALVADLTNVSVLSDGNRATRKALDRKHIAAAQPRAMLIKLADRLDNATSIFKHDPKFGLVYGQEAELLLQDALCAAPAGMPVGSPLEKAYITLRTELLVVIQEWNERKQATL